MTTRKSAAAASPKKMAVKKPAARKPASAAGAFRQPAPSVSGHDAAKPKKEGKVKVVHDSFTMPQGEYQKIAEIKALCLKGGLHVKKSEVLRAGLIALSSLNAAQVKRALAGVERIKAGRPKKN